MISQLHREKYAGSYFYYMIGLSLCTLTYANWPPWILTGEYVDPRQRGGAKNGIAISEKGKTGGRKRDAPRSCKSKRDVLIPRHTTEFIRPTLA